MNAIEFDNVGKLYKLGLVGTGTLSNDLNRWWKMSVLHQEDPYLKIGETNDRTSKGESDYVWALKDISFNVEQGDVVGIIGKNGAGKSTLLKLLSRVTSPTTGAIRARGRIGSLLEVGTGFHPELTGRENIYMNGSIMGMTKHEIDCKLDEIVDFSGCERYIDTPTKRYSSGMTVRLGFAVAAFMEPEILVVDEVLAVGDAEFQKKAIGKMQDVSQGEGRTVLFVSHNMASVKSLCNKGVLLSNGQVRFIGEIEDTVNNYLELYVNQFLDKKLIDLPRSKGCANELVFRDIQYMNEFGEETSPTCGKFLRIQLLVNVERPLENCNFSIGIRNIYDTPLLSFPTDITMDSFNLSKGLHYINCDIPKLPLTGGRYVVRLWASSKGIIQDFVENGIFMDVENGDYFKTGKILKGHFVGKIMLCEHSWNFTSNIES